MSTEQEFQTSAHVRENIVKIVDERGSFYGTGFFIEKNQQSYCITCHHCIWKIDKILIQKDDTSYPAKWIKEYSDMTKDIAVLQVENSPVKSLKYNMQIMPGLRVKLWGFSTEEMATFPKGQQAEIRDLSDDYQYFEWPAYNKISINNEWNVKPKVGVNVYVYPGNFYLGFSGAPVCYYRDNKVVGMFTAKDEQRGYVLPIQTFLEKFSTVTLGPLASINTQEKLEKGNLKFSERNYKEAVEYYDEIIKDRNFVTALVNKGLAFQYSNEYREALKWLDKALMLEPKEAAIMYYKARALYSLNNDPDSFDWYDKLNDCLYWVDRALDTDPNHIMSLIGKGNILLDLRRYEEALKIYDKALSIEPNNATVLYNKGLTFGNMGNYDEEIQWYNKALEIEPDYVLALTSKANALIDLDRFSEALAITEQAIKIDPENEYALDIKKRAQEHLDKDSNS